MSRFPFNVFLNINFFNQTKKGNKFKAHIPLKLNIQSRQSDLNLIENHFRNQQSENESKAAKTAKVSEWFDQNPNDMETSMDEGIGSSGSLSNNNAKNSPINSECLKMVASEHLHSTSRVSAYIGFDEGNIEKMIPPLSDEKHQDDYDQNTDRYDDIGDLDVNVDDDEINNIDDDFNDQARDDLNNLSSEKELEDEYSNEFKHSKFNKTTSRISVFNEDDQHQRIEEDDPLDNLNLNNPSHYHQQQQSSILFWSNQNTKPSSMNDDLNQKISKSNDEPDCWDDDPSILTYPPRRNAVQTTAHPYEPVLNVSKTDDVKSPTTNNSAVDIDSYDQLPNYAEATQGANKPRVFDANDLDLIDKSSTRFITSNLLVNNDLGTRTLEIKMDKRIDLKEFKKHVGSFLKLNNENFRVFRMCPNDFECELTSCENQFNYLSQNTKFVIKLGRPLKYGEYMVPIYRLNREKNSMTYMCDFMILHGMTVLNHKELLCDDLRDEFNLEVSVDRY